MRIRLFKAHPDAVYDWRGVCEVDLDTGEYRQHTQWPVKVADAAWHRFSGIGAGISWERVLQELLADKKWARADWDDEDMAVPEGL